MSTDKKPRKKKYIKCGFPGCKYEIPAYHYGAEKVK